MAKALLRTSRTVSALLLGLAATAMIAACHLVGLDRRAELLALDLRFRRLSSAPANDAAVIVEIDDHSLEQLGRWPWPRELLAGIVRTLHECGARAVALDIIMPEPQATRYVASESDVYDADTAPLLGVPGPRVVFDDADFEQALRDTRVLLPMHIDFDPNRHGGKPGPDAAVRSAVLADPNVAFTAVLRQALPDLPQGVKTPALDAAARAYRRERSLHFLERFAASADDVAGYPVGSGTIIPPLVRFAAQCRGSGFVTFLPEIDGVMRRIPLLAESGGHVYPQFALSLAAERSSPAGRARIRADASHVAIAGADRNAAAIPVDAQGRMLINWTTARGAFREVPAASVGFVWQSRKRMEKNRRFARLVSLAIARRLGQRELLELFARGDVLYQKRIAYEVSRQRAALYSPANVPAPPKEITAAEEQTERQIDELTAEILGELDFFVGSRPKDDPERQAIERLAEQHAELTRANRQRRREIAEELARIGKLVKGRLCIVGSTATGAADFVPTPIAAQMPGVLVHANIFNTIVSGAFVTEAHPAANLAAILLVGALVSLLGARLPILQAGPLVVLLVAGYASLNLVVFFAALSCWLVLMAPMAAAVAALLVVTAYRQLTEERAKRHIRGLFAHALSPALVDRLIEDPSVARLGGERRVLSCFFSDLTHFTPLAERLGERDTVGVLNRYFDRMTEVIQTRCGGYLNKLLGDGILGFFGAPVVQADHARRAMAAAVECQQEVASLNESLVGDFGDWVALSCRIGVATGPAMVGNCGSTQRMDYTAIGDCVNLASRLESANKQFATWILVDEEAWRQGDDGSLLARPMGGIVVVGKAEPVGVWNVICPMAAASDDLRAAVADFARGVELFARRGFAEAVEAFEAVLARRPADRPSELFLSLCRQYLAAPPPEQWNGAVRLTEK